MPKVLIVEDEKILRDAYEILLASQKNLHVDSAANGVEALELCGHTDYDLILLDLMMPLLDGTGFLKEARLAKNSPHTRVVIMSNISSGNEIHEAMKLGAHAHAVKADLAPSDVMTLVKKELSLAV